MVRVAFSGSDNPDGLVSIVNSLPSAFHDSDYEIVFPDGFLYSTPFPIIAAWSKRAPTGTRISLDVTKLKESGRRLVENVGLTDIVENDLESASRVMKGSSNVPLQPIVVGHATEVVLDRVYHMVDEWAGTRDLKPFKTILSELAENVLLHSEASAPGYVHARVHKTANGEKCEITFADCGIGIKNSYLEGTNESAKARILGGASALQIAVDGLVSSKPKEITPGGRSHFGYGLYTVKRLIELNRGRMTVISGNEFLTLTRQETKLGKLTSPWTGTIVSLVIDLGNPLPLEAVYEEEHERLVAPPRLDRGKRATPEPVNQTTPEQSAGPVPRTRLALKDFSTKLLAREAGVAVRAELATLLADGSIVEVDLAEIEDITPSVADECFGKLAARLGDTSYHKRIVFVGGTSLLTRLIDFVVANRLKGHGATGQQP